MQNFKLPLLLPTHMKTKNISFFLIKGLSHKIIFKVTLLIGSGQTRYFWFHLRHKIVFKPFYESNVNQNISCFAYYLLGESNNFVTRTPLIDKT